MENELGKAISNILHDNGWRGDTTRVVGKIIDLRDSEVHDIKQMLAELQRRMNDPWSFTLGQLQIEQAEWARHNFPGNHEAWEPLLGVVEEVGELSHHHLKGYQGIRNDVNHDREAQDDERAQSIVSEMFRSAKDDELKQVMLMSMGMFPNSYILDATEVAHTQCPECLVQVQMIDNEDNIVILCPECNNSFVMIDYQ